MSTVKFKTNTNITAIPNVFIDEYMAKPNTAVFSLIYIYGYRCAAEGVEVSTEDLAKVFGILESDVLKAWNYWDSQGVIQLERSNNELGVVFLPLTGHESEYCSTEKKAHENIEKAYDKQNEAFGKKQTPVSEIRANYNPSEIEEVRNRDESVTELFDLAQSMMGKVLTQMDTQALVEMHDYLGLPNELIAILLTYAGEKKKKMRYVLAVANDWHSKGVTTVEAAEIYLSSLTDAPKVMKFFGITAREASEDERGLIYTWLAKYKMSKELIKLACEKTLAATGKPSFAYADAILKNWHENNVTTPEEAKAQSGRGKGKTSGKEQKPKNNSFNSFSSQRDYDEAELERVLKDRGRMR